jgi:hypothetical protein
MTMSKWILRGLLVASAFASYDCRRRRNNNDNNQPATNAPTNAPQTPPVQQPGVQPGVQPGSQPGMQPGTQPGMQQPGMQQPGMQPGMQQPGMQQPGMQQPGMQQPGMQQPGMQQPQAGGDYLQGQMTMRQGQFAAGMNPVMPLTRGSLATGASQNYSVQMQPGHCYKIIGVGAPGVQDLDLKLYGPDGAQVDQDIATDNYPVIGLQQPLCPTTAGAYRLEALMFAGTGEFAVQVFGN